ncbi:hypothetical protein [Planococcus sp. ISL-109]|uniref:hypothetical protein n=1 Tax=Planococcus sp. ISL-109 TaxID=2819166 RepID=UPI001BE63712|nr:hypothetical protein [Planococcus sp. ISL-109]MBT2583811.1 hypothetical protein [Planococcus sp. ISL-109]
MKRFAVFPALFLIMILAACSESKDVENAESGEFFLDSIYMDSVEANSTYSMIHEIEWTGEEAVTINSFDLVKENHEPVTFDEDGMAYEVYGADPLKQVGVYSEDHNIGAVEDISGYEIDDTGRIVLVLRLGEVAEDPHRAARINYTVNGEEQEVIYDWDGYKQFSTEES